MRKSSLLGYKGGPLFPHLSFLPPPSFCVTLLLYILNFFTLILGQEEGGLARGFTWKEG